MAVRTGKVVALFASVTFNSVDLSNYFNSAMIQQDRDIQEVTGFKTAKTNRAREYDYGLDTIMFTGGVFLDYAAAKSYATINTAFVAGTAGGVAMVCRPDFEAVAMDNPQFTFNALVASWTPLNTALQQPMFTNVNWTVNGALTIATS